MRNQFTFEAEPINLEWLGENGGPPIAGQDKSFTDLIREIRKELNRPFRSPTDPGLHARRRRLRQLFGQIPPTHTKKLFEQLGPTRRNNEFSKLFHYRLATPERRELLEILKRNFPVIAPPTAPPPPTPGPQVLVWGTRPLPASENGRFTSALKKLQQKVAASGDPRTWRYVCWFAKLLSGADDRLIRWSSICPETSGAIGAAYIVGACDITLGRAVKQEHIEKGIKSISDVDTVGDSIGIITYLRSEIVVAEELTSLPLENLRALHDNVQMAVDKLDKWANNPMGGSSAMPKAYVSIKDWIGRRQRDPKSLYSCM
jgi:hypothetical protein